MLERTDTEAPPETQEAVAGAAGARTLDDTTLCPYLRTLEGDWRAAWALRDHRCGAVEPPAPLTGEKQRRLCLVPAHVDCVTYQAAERAGVAAVAGDRQGDSVRELPRWPVPRTAPVVLDRTGRAPIDWRPDRSLAQIGLVALMILAFAMLAVARFSAPSGPAATPAASTIPSGSPAGSVPASGGSAATYRVQPGDTLVAIAARYGTTVAVLQELNGIEDPSMLRVGVLLRIPPSPIPSATPGASSSAGTSGGSPSDSP